MPHQVITELEETIHHFATSLANVPDEKLNKVPFAGSWTPAQLADHVLKSLSGLPMLLQTKGEEITSDPEEKKQSLADIFLNFDTKMKSPDFIKPGDAPIDRVTLLTGLQSVRQQIPAALQEYNITKAYTLPAAGTYTGVEWAWFMNYHTVRHTHQLNKMMTAAA